MKKFIRRTEFFRVLFMLLTNNLIAEMKDNIFFLQLFNLLLQIVQHKRKC